MPNKQSRSIKKDTAELGGSGTSVYGGVVSEVEYKSDLSTEYGGTGLKIYDRMRKSDPIVKSTLLLVKLAIMQADWIVEASGDTPEEEEQRDLVEEALFDRMEKSFEKTLEEILTYLDFGFYVTEKVFKMEDGKVFIKKLAFRDHKSISKFETKDGKEGITQILTGDAAKKIENKGLAEVSIPADKILVFTNQKEGDNYRGVSVFRSAYKPWYMKENIEKIDAIGFERAAVGVPIFRMPSNPKPEDVTKAEELGAKFRSNEKAYLLLPNGWEFEITDSKYDGEAADKAIRRYNRDIYSNLLAVFLDLGSGPSGSRALSVDQSTAFYKSLQAIADYIASVINDGLIKDIVDYNFNGVVKYPKLRATGIVRIDIDQFSAGLQRLSMAGLLSYSTETEKFIRSELKLPELNDEDIELIEERKNRDMNTDPNDPNLDQNKGKETKDKAKGKDNPNNDKKGSEKKSKKFGLEDVVVRQDFWRPLMFAEQKVNLRSLRRQMDIMEADLNKELPKTLSPEIQSLLNDARQALQSRDSKRIEDLAIKFKSDVREKIIGTMKSAFEAGKLSAANEMDVKAPITSNEMINQITTKANAMADKLTQDLLNQAKLTTMDHIERGTQVDDAMVSIEQALMDVSLNSSSLISSVATNGGINQGRYSVFEEHPEMIHSVMRSEILDDHVCNFCLSMDGRSVFLDDPIVKNGTFHFRCRGIWVEILNEEAELPPVSGIPQQLRDRVGALADFKQIPNAVPLSGSLAEEFVNQ